MRRSSALVALAYLALSVALFGRGALADPSGSVVGLGGSDQGVFMWSLEWWPHAITTLHDPLQTDLVYAPTGWNLAWTSVIGGPALALWPVTAAFGPVVALNVLALLAPALAAQSAFLLCRELTARTAPSAIGGLVFGFSTFMASQMVNHVNLALCFPLPLAALAVLRHARGRTTTRRFVVELALPLLACYSIFLETFLTLSVLSAVGLVIAHVVVDRQASVRLWRTTRIALITYVGVCLLTAPYTLHAMLAGNEVSQVLAGGAYPLDLASTLSPTRVTEHHWLRPLAPLRQIVNGDNFTEQGAYVGPIVPLVVVLAIAALRRSRLLWGTLAFAAIALAFAIGPTIYYAGRPVGELPLGWILSQPLMRTVLLVRVFVYVWLALAVLTALLVARLPAAAGIALATALALTLVPSLDRSSWTTSLTVPAFFDNGLWRSAVRENDKVLIVPPGFAGNSMFWQARTGFAFRMTGGYVSAIPPDQLWRYPTYRSMFTREPVLEPARELRRLLVERAVDDVVVVDGQDPRWEALMGAVATGRQIGGVTVWRVPRWLR